MYEHVLFADFSFIIRLGPTYFDSHNLKTF